MLSKPLVPKYRVYSFIECVGWGVGHLLVTDLWVSRLDMQFDPFCILTSCFPDIQSAPP